MGVYEYSTAPRNDQEKNLGSLKNQKRLYNFWTLFGLLENIMSVI